MYVPAVSHAAAMATEVPKTEEATTLSLSTEVTSSTASSIYIKWAMEGPSPTMVHSFQVFYNRFGSEYHQYSRKLTNTTHTYGISNLVADTYYKVCVAMYHSNSSQPTQGCVDASTTSWHIPVSIGSSIGAVLALSIIVLIVLLSRCPNLVRQPRTAAAESSKYDSMSSHYPDDRYEMSDTTTHCHDHEREEDLFSRSSEGDSLSDQKGACKQHPHGSSPQSLAERVCNGSRMSNGVAKHPRANAPLGRCNRTLSLTERRHNPHRMRQARLAHLHTNFHSIQSEPGGIPTRQAPRVSITDFPASSNSADLASSRKTLTSSTPSTNGKQSSAGPTPCTGCNSKPVGYKDTPRLMYRIESATSTSEPTFTDSHKDDPVKVRPPPLKNINKTIHMSMDGDTLV